MRKLFHVLVRICLVMSSGILYAQPESGNDLTHQPSPWIWG